MVVYSAQNFVRALTSDEGLPPPIPPVVQTGMVDPERSSSEEIRFAPGTQCLNWIKVPVSIIDEVDHLRNQRCGQYEYPYVRVHLKDPTELTDEGRAIIGILQPGTTPGPTMYPTTMPVPTRPEPTSPHAPPASRHKLPTLPTMPAPYRGCS